MKSSSGINIGNGNNCRENRKTTTTSFSSASPSASINKRVTKTSTTSIKPSNAEQDITKREEQQLNEFIQPAHSFYTASTSTFQSESVSSKFKFEITPETISQFNHHPTSVPRRQRTQWVTRHASLHSKPKIPSTTSSVILSSSSIDLNTTTMATSSKSEILNAPNVSITEMTSKAFEDEYQRFVEPSYQQSQNHDELDQTLKCTSINLVSDDDDDDDDEKEKVFIDQGSQAVLLNGKPRKKIKSASHHKKIKSATKRPKQPSATQVTHQPSLSASPTRTGSQADLTAGTITRLTTRIEDINAGKNTITVDTSKARSNLEVVRLCLRDLGWKEVRNTIIYSIS